MHESWRYVLVLFAYPVLEEIIFRWGLLAWLDKQFPQLPRIATNIAASAVFVAAHFYVQVSLLAAAVFVPSLVLGFVWQRRRSLVLCVMLHSAFNLIWYVTTSNQLFDTWSRHAFVGAWMR